MSYAILCIFGWLRDFLRQSNVEKKRGAVDPNASLVNASFFKYHPLHSLDDILGFCAIISKLWIVLYTKYVHACLRYFQSTYCHCSQCTIRTDWTCFRWLQLDLQVLVIHLFYFVISNSIAYRLKDILAKQSMQSI